MDEQDEKDLDLFIAKLIEHAEWEATLPEAERSRRRLPKLIAEIPHAARTAAEHDIPWVLLSQLERVYHHCNVLFGSDWMEQAVSQRKQFLYGDDFDETEAEGE